MDKKKVNKSSPFINQLFTLIGGSLGTYLFPIIFSPILTRIYTPEEFAVYTIYLTIINIVAIVAALKYELGIPLVNNTKERYDLFRLSIINTIIVSFLIFAFFSFYNNYVGSHSRQDLQHLEKLKYFVPIGIVLTSLFYHILYNFLLYKKKFNYISIAKIVFGFLYATLPIFIFKFYGLKDYILLIYSHQMAIIAGLLIIVSLVSRSINFVNIRSIFIFSIKDLLSVLKKYNKFPLFSAPSQLINTLGIWLPVILIWNYFDIKYASLYLLSHRAINMPVMLLGHSIGKIFYSEAASNLSQGTLDKSISKYFKVLFHMAFPFILVCIFLAPDIFNAIFSSNWSEAGQIVQILSPWLFITFIAAPLSTIPTIYYKQELEFQFNSLILLGRFIALGVGLYYDDLFLGLALYSASNCFIWIVYLIYMLKLSNLKIRLLLLQCMDHKYEYLIILGLILMIHFFVSSPFYTLVCLSFLLIYLVYSFILIIKSNFHQVESAQ